MPDEVTILWWPEEGTRLLRLRDERKPRLVVIEGDMLPPPPPTWSEEEWLHSPFPPEQLDHSLTTLRARLRKQPPPPEVAGDDVLWFASRAAPLPAREAPLAKLLTTAFGRVVPYSALYTAVGLTPVTDDYAFNGLISRLRRRIKPLGLELKALRGTGYVMHSRAIQLA